MHLKHSYIHGKLGKYKLQNEICCLTWAILTPLPNSPSHLYKQPPLSGDLTIIPLSLTPVQIRL